MSCRERLYRRCEIVSTRRLGRDIFELAVAWEGPRPEPGQFYMLRAERSAVLLGRPISVFAADDRALSFVVAERGSGTRELGELREGDGILLEGPLGSAWETAAFEKPGTSRAGPPLALLGGGIGLAPIAFLARGLRAGSFDLFAGFRSGAWGLDGLSPRELRVFTEDGSLGVRGRVLDGFDPSNYAGIYACGPEPMLRALAGIAKDAGVPAWISLERRMACGVGACLGCTVRCRGGNRRACVEGPVFLAEEVIFNE